MRIHDRIVIVGAHARALAHDDRFPNWKPTLNLTEDRPPLPALTLDALNRDSDAEKMYRNAIAAGDKQASIEYEKFRRKRPRAATMIR